MQIYSLHVACNSWYIQLWKLSTKLETRKIYQVQNKQPLGMPPEGMVVLHL